MKTKLCTHIFLLTVFLTVATQLSAQSDPQIVWENTIGGSANDNPTCSWPTSDGGIILGGTSGSGISGDKTEAASTTDYWIIKLAANGTIQWQNTIGGSSLDDLKSMQQTADGGYILGGSSISNISRDKSENAIGNGDYWVIKLDSSGAIEWQNTIGGTGFEELLRVRQTYDGGYIVGGYSNSTISGDKSEDTIGSYDYWIVKLNAAGVVQWDNTIGGTGMDIFRDLALAADGGFLVCGYSSSNISADKSENNIGNEDYWIVKLDASGVRQWDNTIGGIYGDVLTITQATTDHGFILAGHSASGISVDKTEANVGDIDFWIIKLDSTGNITWQNTIGGPDFDRPQCIEQCSDGGYILGGTSLSGVGGDKNEPNYGSLDFWIMKLDAIGNIEWQNSINGDGIEDLTSVEQTTDGAFVASGTAELSTASGDKSEGSMGGVDYWVLKLKSPVRAIHGNVFADMNANCLLDTSVDVGMKNRIIADLSRGQHAISDMNGDYSLLIFSDTATIYVSNLPDEDDLSCLAHDTLSIYTGGADAYDTLINFPVQASVICHHLDVNISCSSMRRCSNRTYTVPYENVGFDTAYAAFVIVEIDTSVIDLVSSAYTFTQSGDTLIFPLGDVLPLHDGQFTFIVHVKCDAVLGSSVCARAYIYPLNNCEPPSPDYDGSDVIVSLSCMGDTVLAKVKNKADTHDMTHYGIITAIEDEIIQRIDTFMLPGGVTQTYRYVPLADKTLTLEVRQDINHPERPVIITQDELCALTTPIKLHSVVSSFSRFDEADEYEESCLPIVGSYDPNLKSVFPQGFTERHFTDSNQILEYRIDFQNTGFDTAFKVVIIDTLSPLFNINSFVPLVASHVFRTELEGTSTVKFIFDPIALPDSNASEPNSHGYVTFKIRPKSNLPKGAVINNFADIYFDFNTPVRTNAVFNTIYDTVLMKTGVGIFEPTESMDATILVFPNPSTDKFYIKLDKDMQEATVKLTDASGKEIEQVSQVNGSSVEMNADRLSKGLYFILIYEKNNLIARSKVIIQ